MDTDPKAHAPSRKILEKVDLPPKSLEKLKRFSNGTSIISVQSVIFQ